MSISRVARYKVPRSVTVDIDTREHLPIPFPKHLTYYSQDHPAHGAHRIAVHTDRVKLDEGDYRLRGYKTEDGRYTSILERKKDLGEITTNLLTDDRTRAEAALQRLAAATPNPYLLLEQSLFQAVRPCIAVPDPALSLDTLYRVLDTYRIRLLWIGSGGSVSTRRNLGEQIIRIFFSHALSGTTIPIYDDLEGGEPPPSQKSRLPAP